MFRYTAVERLTGALVAEKIAPEWWQVDHDGHTWRSLGGGLNGLYEVEFFSNYEMPPGEWRLLSPERVSYLCFMDED